MVSIYVLINPVTKEIFYVGCTTKTLEERLKSHYLKVYEARRKDINWNKRLEYLENLLPLKAEIHLIDTCEYNVQDRVEEKYIKFYKQLNPNLTNQTFGGVGGDTYSLQSEATKLKISQKISDKTKGRKLSTEQVEYMSKSRVGYGNPMAGFTTNPPICVETKTQILVFLNGVECKSYYNNRHMWGNFTRQAKDNRERENKGIQSVMNKAKQIVTFPENCRPRIKDIVQSILERDGFSYLYDKETKTVTENIAGFNLRRCRS